MNRLRPVHGLRIDIEHCPHCGRALKIIAAILEKATLTKLLDHLGLPVLTSAKSGEHAEARENKRIFVVGYEFLVHGNMY